MFARVVVYSLKAETGDRTVREAEQTLLPVFRQLPGFISYEVVKTGPDTAISISHWETEPDAHAAMDAGAQWVRDHAMDNVLQSAGYVGVVAFYHAADHLVVTALP